MKTTYFFIRNNNSSKQRGITLIEVMVSLSIFALIIGGALSLFGSASASQTTSQMKSDLSAIRVAVKSLYFGQGGYGVANLNSTLISANKVPATMPVAGAVINHSQNGTVTVTGATSQYTVAVTNISTDVCIGLVSGTNGWVNLKIGAAAVINTFPIAPSLAATQCAATDPIAITFTAS